jgi:hypothetical protein
LCFSVVTPSLSLANPDAPPLGFTVFGLPESTVTHWHYTFTGSIEAATGNAALQLQATFAWDLRHSIRAFHCTSWGVAWVDGPPEFGDFAGNLANSLGTT